MSDIPVFVADQWHTTAPGVWEATAKPAAPGGRPPFEATCWATTPTSERHRWAWALHQPTSDSPEAELVDVATGTAATLLDAQRQSEQHARAWRDQPAWVQAEAAIATYNEQTQVSCDACGTTHRIGELITRQACDAEHNGHRCGSRWFNGRHLNRLTRAATQ